MDLLVEDRVVVLLGKEYNGKDLYRKQLLTCLRLGQKPLGVLIHFGETVSIKVFPGFFQEGPPETLSCTPANSVHATEHSDAREGLCP